MKIAMLTLLYILRIKNWLSSYIESLLGQERHYGEKETKTIDMFKYRVWERVRKESLDMWLNSIVDQVKGRECFNYWR